jgi:hypothetical protein
MMRLAALALVLAALVLAQSSRAQELQPAAYLPLVDALETILIICHQLY